MVSFACLVHANEIMAAVFGYPPERLTFYAAFGRVHCAARRDPVGVATTVAITLPSIVRVMSSLLISITVSPSLEGGVLARIIETAGKTGSFEPTQAGNVGSAACAS